MTEERQECTSEGGKKDIFSKINRFIEKYKLRSFKGVAVLLVFCVLLPSGLVVGIHALTTVKSRTVSFGLKDIGELATQAGYFTNVQVINGSRQIWGTDIPLTQSKYVYSYDGIIKAGLDFESIDVNINEITHTITVELPEVRILSSEVDEQSLEIYDETKSIFTPLSLSSVNMSLIEMKKEASEKAISNGLLENARSNAEMLIRGFLAGSFDLASYSVIFK